MYSIVEILQNTVIVMALIYSNVTGKQLKRFCLKQVPANKERVKVVWLAGMSGIIIAKFV